MKLITHCLVHSYPSVSVNNQDDENSDDDDDDGKDDEGNDNDRGDNVIILMYSFRK